MRHAFLAAAAALAVTVSAPAQSQDLRAEVAADMPELLALYRHLHAHPELSGAEHETAAKLAGIARELGFAVTEGVGGTGVVAVMENGAGPVLMMRADMDGLPVTEQTGLDYASKVTAIAPQSGVETGVMHACGHDTHMTAWVGAARQLVERKDDWSGTLVMILQPAEETGEGAKAMIEDGLFTRFPMPTHAIAFHDAAAGPAGFIGLSSGYALANVDSVDITVRGVGGHGAYPNTTRDPIVIASRIVSTLQTIVARELDPQEPAVVTVGSFHAGAKHNIIPDEAELLLTVRSYSDETRAHLLGAIERIARAEAMAADVPADRMPIVTIREAEYTPSTYNSPALTQHAHDLFTRTFGTERVRMVPPVMGGEDFGRFYRENNDIESLIFWVGGQPLDKWQAAGGDPAKLPSLHSPFWAPDAEAVVATATEALTTLALDILGS
ncbi:M20 metallopeptidase family protein [Sphingomicrobium astaxanthinifaciens]|uniref:M20 metallopeptidase family protein n=1 Tax=Sphingomicrobium astaxanthinifaciens TaxID=1227949 RepID=UPI001FCB597E|nr:amidohydrolase [Sphingomicrobium astaxanthinifaciens]MCJ7420726.1 amidohydrolase [Sphingomicrobium astaxanthinifaciens]